MPRNFSHPPAHNEATNTSVSFPPEITLCPAPLFHCAGHFKARVTQQNQMHHVRCLDNINQRIVNNYLIISYYIIYKAVFVKSFSHCRTSCPSIYWVQPDIPRLTPVILPISGLIFNILFVLTLGYIFLNNFWPDGRILKIPKLTERSEPGLPTNVTGVDLSNHRKSLKTFHEHCIIKVLFGVHV